MTAHHLMTYTKGILTVFSFNKSTELWLSLSPSNTHLILAQSWDREDEGCSFDMVYIKNVALILDEVREC